MKTPGAKILIALLLLVQIAMPVQTVLAMPMMPASTHKVHCHMGNNESVRQDHRDTTSPCMHCLQHEKETLTSGQPSTADCHAKAGCSTCADGTHASLMVLNDYIFLHQTTSYSLILDTDDIYKYFPPLKLRPPRS